MTIGHIVKMMRPGTELVSAAAAIFLTNRCSSTNALVLKATMDPLTKCSASFLAARMSLAVWRLLPAIYSFMQSFQHNTRLRLELPVCLCQRKIDLYLHSYTASLSHRIAIGDDSAQDGHKGCKPQMTIPAPRRRLHLRCPQKGQAWPQSWNRSSHRTVTTA